MRHTGNPNSHVERAQRYCEALRPCARSAQRIRQRWYFVDRKSEKTNMSELTLESLARRLEHAERRLNEKQATGAKDWRIAAGTFTGREFSKIVDEEGRKIRDADPE
jgi:hypothetical protein